MIYFDKDKNAFSFEIENYIAQIDEPTWMEYAGTDKWDIVDGVFKDITTTPAYVEKKRREEEIRISKLKCTKRVFVLMLEKMGLDYFEQIEPLINNNRQAKLEWELCVELERSNNLLDILAKELGVTSKQLDLLFQYANGEDVKLEVVNG